MLPRGPSPRVRGSHMNPAEPLDGRGSIPACAGKPHEDAHGYPLAEVHPRVCGEADYEEAARKPVPGPSPRVRGSPAWVAVAVPSSGSIPACAGKPRGRRGTGS